MVLIKLLQKSDVTLVEQLNVVNSIFQNGNSLHSHAESESRKLGRVIIHETEYIGIDHAAAEQLNPSAGFAVRTAVAVPPSRAPTEEARNLDVGAWFGEGEK